MAMTMTATAFLWTTLLIFVTTAVHILLVELNRRYAQGRPRPAQDSPGAFDPKEYERAIAYTAAQSRMGEWELAWGSIVLWSLLVSGLLPWVYAVLTRSWGESVVSVSAFILLVSLLLHVAGAPFSWYRQFHLEEKFGFNRMTPRLWWSDQFKGLVLSILIGFPVLLLVLRSVHWAGPAWWLWAWAGLMVFQIVLLIIWPILILPWFNRLTPLPAGSLQEKLMTLSQSARFPVQSIHLMDGSKRSSHSNALFTGFGHWRRIILFDTLVNQLSEDEVQSVVAHEIGHYKKKHVLIGLLTSALFSLAGFWILAWLVREEILPRAFGFASSHPGLTLLLAMLLASYITFWVGWPMNFLSRRHEYQADAFAAGLVGQAAPLIQALRRIHKENLSNPAPHPLYAALFYSHPTLPEREQALLQLPPATP